MPKLTLSDVTNLGGNPVSAQQVINTNSERIEAAIEKTLSRDGTSPNQMEADFDMNHYDVLNAGTVYGDKFVIDGVEFEGTASWVISSGAPGTSVGKLGDVYLNSLTGDVYGPKTSSGWGSVAANIKGPQGAQGPQGVQGIQGVQGLQGMQGPQGLQGPQGVQGVQGEKGDSFSPDAIGLTSDRVNYDDEPKGFSFLDSQTGYLYFKLSATSGDWSPGITFTTGPQGPVGPQGIQGPEGPQGVEGPQGPIGPAGVGVPTGGTSGQVLTKNTSTDYDTSWKTVADARDFDTISVVQNTSVDSLVNFIRTGGYHTAGDGGGALYKRVGSEPVHAGKVQSADGAWWELATDIPNVLQFGAGASGSVSDEFADAISYAVDRGLEKVFVPDRSYVLNTRVTIPNGIKLDVGAGVSFSGTGDFRLADGTAAPFSLVQGEMFEPTKRARLETENVIIDSFIGTLDTFDQRSDVKQVRKHWDGKVTGTVVHAGAISSQFYDYGARSISDPATGGISLDTNWARIHSMQYQSTGRANEVTPWAVGVDSSNIGGNAVGGSVYNEISFHSAAGTTSNTEKFFAGINMFMGRYSPTGSLSETNRGSAGMSIITIPGGGGFKSFDKAGLTSYPLMAGISLGGWTGPVGVATTPTAATATAAFETALKIGGAIPTNWLTNPSIGSKIDRGITIEDHDLVGIRIGNKYDSGSTSTMALTIFSGGGEVLIGGSTRESAAKMELRQAGGGEVFRMTSVPTGYTGNMEVRRAAATGSNAWRFAMYQSNNGSDTEFSFLGDGNALCDGSWTGGGADYAEFFEWSDGNPNSEDRRGFSVTLEGDKIRPAVEGDTIIGVISVNPSVVGDGDIDQWKEKYLRDEFGEFVLEDYEVVEWEQIKVVKEAYDVVSWKLDDGEEITFPVDAVPSEVVVPENAVTRTVPQEIDVEVKSCALDGLNGDLPEGARVFQSPNKRKVLNPDFDPTLEYVSRRDRKEWAMVGLMGKLRLRKGQPVNPNWIRMREVSSGVDEWLVR